MSFATLYCEVCVFQVWAIVLLVIHPTILHQVLANFLSNLLDVQFHQWDVMPLHVLHYELRPTCHVEVGYLGLNVVQVARLLEVFLHSICEVLDCSVRQLLNQFCLQVLNQHHFFLGAFDCLTQLLEPFLQVLDVIYANRTGLRFIHELYQVLQIGQPLCLVEQVLRILSLFL